MEYTYNSFRPAVIYIFRINDIEHAGMLKIGMATLPDEAPLEAAPNSSILNDAARARIKQYTQTAAISFDLLHTESAVAHFNKEVFSISDKKVHDVLLRSGIKRGEFSDEKMGREWFIVDLETAKQAITAAKQKRNALTAKEITQEQTPIVFRPEQKEAIERTCKKFERYNQMLWNAKMRFGKTLSALQVVANCEFKRTIILTHRPVVDKGWYEDFGKIFAFVTTPYMYGSKTKGTDLTTMENSCKLGKSSYIYFASMQDLRGSELVGGKFDKNDRVFSIPWDCVIVDEAHEGTQTKLGQNVLNELIKRTTKVLQLSGTPFNLFDQYSEDEIFTWDYVMEQKAKLAWDATHFGDPNPYAGLPAMNIYTFDLGNLMSMYMDMDIAFNFTEFFRTREKDGSFVHEKDVRAFLDLLVKEDKESMFPFSNQKFRDNFRHTLWMVPGVRAAKALSAMLKNHPVFGYFSIVNVAGDGDEGECKDALELVQKAIKNHDYTITISCGKLTTGVSVPEWTAVMMLSGTFNTAASSYMQTIFRVQTPYKHEGMIKENCYVFDFAPDRTLQVIAETAKVSAKAGKTSQKDRETLGEFLNFCPIIACQGTQMKDRITADRLFEQLKKVYVERVVKSGFEDKSLYSEELLKMDDIALKDFDELKKIIGETKANHSTGQVDINNQGLTDEEYDRVQDLNTKKKKQQLTPEEEEELQKLKKAKDNRNAAISILRGISIRMPLLIYGADLTGKIKEVTIDNFTQIVDDSSWEEFMPKGVSKLVFANFRKYYDADIFLAAGRRILALAKAADQMGVEQRISQIAAIFNNFRNPDKETVLTPWRVVNMHMSDTLGGYCFYNEDFTEMIDDPRPVLHFGVTEKVFRPDAKIMEINSKTGLYPLYVAYSLYRAKAKDSLFQIDTIEEQQRIWDDVVANNIFVICKTPMAKSITQRTLLGFRNGKANLVPMEDLIEQVQNNKTELIEKITKGQVFKNFKDMKFTAIVGNPPYQLTVAKKETNNGQKRVSNIFHYFQILADSLAQHTSLIYPAVRWIHQSGKGVESFGLEQINDVHLQKLIVYPEAGEIFERVDIPDGISIVEKDMSKDDSGFEYQYVVNNNRITIHQECPGKELMVINPNDAIITRAIREVATAKKFGYLSDSVMSQKLFAIESDFVENNPRKVRLYKEGAIFDKESEVKLLANDKAGAAGRANWYITKRELITTSAQYIDKWKVVVSSAHPGGQDKRNNQLQVLDNYSVFGRARVALKMFDTEEEARNFYKYAQSELIRYAFLLTDEALTSFARLTPDILNYKVDNGVIDFSGDVNKQLYALFNISEKEQEYIKSILKKDEIDLVGKNNRQIEEDVEKKNNSPKRGRQKNQTVINHIHIDHYNDNSTTYNIKK